MAESDTIYVYLLDEGTDCWKQVSAEHLGNDVNRIISVNKDPEDERWEFGNGEVVRYRHRKLACGLRRLALVPTTIGTVGMSGLCGRASAELVCLASHTCTFR